LAVDDIAPFISNLYSDQTTNITRSDVIVTFNVTATDDFSGILGVIIDGGIQQLMSEVGGVVLAPLIPVGSEWSYIGTPASIGCISAGPCNITAIAVDNAGNFNWTSYLLTIPALPPTGSAPFVSAPGGGSTSEPSLTFTLALVVAGTETSIPIDSSTIPISDVSLTLDENSNLVKLVVQPLSSLPSTITSPPAGTIFKYIELTLTNVDPTAIGKATITFKIDKAWFESNNLDPSTTALSRYHDGAWTSLATTQTSSDDNYYYFEAETPGFSTFAIAASVAPPTPTICSSTCPTGQSQRAYPDCSCYTPATGETEQPSEQQIIAGISNYDLLAYMIIGTLVVVFAAYWALKKAKITEL